LRLLLLRRKRDSCFFQKHTAETKDCFLYDGNNIFVVFIGALECERVWEFIQDDHHLKIIIVEWTNYV